MTYGTNITQLVREIYNDVVFNDYERAEQAAQLFETNALRHKSLYLSASDMIGNYYSPIDAPLPADSITFLANISWDRFLTVVEERARMHDAADLMARVRDAIIKGFGEPDYITFSNGTTFERH